MSGIEASILVGFSWMFFDIQMQGSFLALVVLFLSGTLTFAGIAILTASRTDNTYVGKWHPQCCGDANDYSFRHLL